MPYIHKYNDVTKFKLRPMASLFFYYAVGKFIEFTNLEQDSNYVITPITRADAIGGERIIAHRISITAYPMQDNYTEIIHDLLSHTNILTDCHLVIGNHEPMMGAAPHPVINATGGAVLDMGYGANMKWSVESADKRRRLKIEVNKVIRTNADGLDDETNQLYYLLSDEDE
jgi:hypothetical protein